MGGEGSDGGPVALRRPASSQGLGDTTGVDGGTRRQGGDQGIGNA